MKPDPIKRRMEDTGCTRTEALSWFRSRVTMESIGRARQGRKLAELGGVFAR